MLVRQGERRPFEGSMGYNGVNNECNPGIFVRFLQDSCMKKLAIPFPEGLVTQFCHRWKITELAVFGSVLRDDFSSQSDVDVLVTFQPGAEWSLIDHVRMEEELECILGRPVDMLTKRAVEQSKNWIRREAILSSAEVVYAQG